MDIKEKVVEAVSRYRKRRIVEAVSKYLARAAEALVVSKPMAIRKSSIQSKLFSTISDYNDILYITIYTP